MVQLIIDFLKNFIRKSIHWFVGLFSEGERLTDFLNYLSYDPETAIYYNKDGSAGFIFECLSNQSTFLLSRSLYKIIGVLPEESIMEISSFSFTGFKDQDQQIDQLIISVRIPEKDMLKKDFIGIKTKIKDILNELNFGVRDYAPQQLIDYITLVFYQEQKKFEWCEYKQISDAIEVTQSFLKEEEKYLSINNGFFSGITPKSCGFNINFEDHSFFYDRELDDNKNPLNFISTLMIIKTSTLKENLDKIKTKKTKKDTGFITRKFVPRTIADFSKVLHEDGFFYFIPITFVFEKSEELLESAKIRIKEQMTTKKHIGQEERQKLLKSLFLCAFPFGFTPSNEAIISLDRHFIGKKDHKISGDV